MGFGIYWIVAISLKLLYTAGSTAKVTRTHGFNTTMGCSSGNQSLSKCGAHAATKNRLKIHRRQMYSTPVGFTFPNVANSYEVDMGYSPNVGFEPYWPGTKREGTTRRDYKVCGVICPSMYISYGPVCGINKKLEYKSFISYCDMRNEDCMNMAQWRAIYKGPCNRDTKDTTTTTTTRAWFWGWFKKDYSSTGNDIKDNYADSLVRTYPTKSSDIKNHISYYITQFMKRTPTTPEPGVMEALDRRKHGLLNLNGSYPEARNSRGGNSKHEEGNTVGKKQRRHSYGGLHGDVHSRSGGKHRRKGPVKSGAKSQSGRTT